ncbi:sulfite exporter TauE/SafE family protein [Luteitalea sp. TBR-22]|uniref:sulfite exporter TauE/SafE family protein n=1 Tax=Luteitalea sp. TBR-22 TaxID=2802971 RepID=UPI001EF4FBA8|nr:sulfite exporter TauE/SafE family protein [Luteitalea sp. TBR-22]
MKTLVMLASAGLIGGAMNALAGGGSFVTLPALIAAGLPSVAANASSTAALFPGGVTSAWVYRGGLTTVDGLPFAPSLVVTLLGGLCGALLLVWTPTTLFDRVLPFLLLAATITLMLGPRLGSRVRSRVAVGRTTVLGVQFVLGTYGGYFGGGVGLMMLAAWSLFTAADIKALNPARMVMVTAANMVAVVCFALLGMVWWRQSVALGLGAMAGGYLGAHLGKRLPARLVRAVMLVIAITMTVLFFRRAFLTT